MPSKRVVVAVVAVLLFLTGCASAGGETPRRSGSPAQATSEPPKAPGQMRFLIEESSGLRFAAPDSWIACDKRVIGEALLDGRLDTYAARMNMDADGLIFDLNVFNLWVAKSGDENIWIATLAGRSNQNPAVIHQFQTEEELRKMFTAFGPVRGVEVVNTPVGPGRVVYFSYGEKPQLRGVGLHFKISSGVGWLTVTMKGDSKARDLMRRIMPTLEDAGPDRTSPRRRTGCEQYGRPLDVPPTTK